MKTKLFTLLLTIVASVGTMFASTKIGDLYYNLNATDKTAEVTYELYLNSSNYNGLTTANIPISVTYNGTTYSVTSIGYGAFYGCTGLTSVTIPNSVTSIGYSAFDRCTGLTSVTIPNSITSIGDQAFNRCTGLTSVTIGNSVTSIGYSAFYGCSGLTSVTIPNSVTSIEWYAFSGCSDLTLIIVENGNTVYDSRNDCNAIIETATNTLIVGCPNTIIPNSVTSIGEMAFRDCSGLTSVTIPNSVTSIGYGAFYGCTGLTSVTIGNSVTSIGESAFSGCSGLTSITIPNSVTSIGEMAFSGCSGLTSVTIPNSVTSIGEGAFSGCTGLTSVTIPNSVTSIGESAFFDCTGLTSVNIPNSVTSIGNYAFRECIALTSVTIPNSVTSIGDQAFNRCTGLTSITIPNSVTSIGEYAFYGCSGLTSITIPNSVTSIGESAFSGCSGLTSITIEAETPPTLGNSAFGARGTIYVPCGTLDAYKSAWPEYADIIQLPQGAAVYTITGKVNDAKAGSVDYPASECGDVVITAFPNYGYHFVKWSDGNTDNPRIIALASDTTFTAEFVKNTYTISTTSANPEWGTTAGDTAALYLDNVRISAIPNYGYHFVRWNDSNTSNPRIVSVTEDKTFTATFAKNVYSITKNAEHGSISGNSSAEYLDEVTLSVSSDYGYHFTQWSDGNTDNPRTIVLSQDTTMEAFIEVALLGKCGKDSLLTWTFDTTTMALNILGKGALTENYTYGNFIESLTIGDEISPIGQGAFRSFSQLKEVKLGISLKVLEENAFANCTSIETITCYSMRPPTVNTNALKGVPYSTIVYVPAAYLNNYLMHDAWGLYDVRPMGVALNLSVNNDQYGVVEGVGTYASGSTVTFSAIPNYGYHFVQWSDGSTQNPRSLVLTQDTTFVATFASNKYSVNVSCDPNLGTIIGNSGEYNYLSQISYEAIANYGYQFAKWSDGNYQNPRTLIVQRDTILIADFTKRSFTLITQSANVEWGTAVGGKSALYLDEVEISATPNYGYHFTQWSDGNTNNPRTIVLTQDTTFTAEFGIDKSGTCGENNALMWTYDDISKTLTISGNGALTSNYNYGVEAPTQMKTLIIGNEVTAIGERAFYGKSTINHLVLGAQLSTIGDYAFAECRNFDDITCYAQDVPAINATTFANVGNKQYIYLYVPEDRERAYKRDTYWGEFDVQVKGASETTTDQNVTVTPNENSAIVTWPTEKNAATYTLQITKDGVVFCTLIFNGAGQLIGISFAPSRDGSSHAPAATVSVAGMSFTVTGLSSASKYAYNLSVADDNNQELVYYQGEFATTGYEGEVVPGGEPVTPGGGTTAIDNANPSTQSVGTTKFFRNGQLFIQRGNELFNAQGARVK